MGSNDIDYDKAKKIKKSRMGKTPKEMDLTNGNFTKNLSELDIS